MANKLNLKTLISDSWLKELGFNHIGGEKWEYIIQQYGGYADFIYYESDRKRLVIQYKCNEIELVKCYKKETLKRALSLVGYKLSSLK